MTFLPLSQLEERRRKGLSPQGGPLPKDQFEKIVGDTAPDGMTSQERCQELHNILLAAWDHPGDTRLWRRMFDLIGKDIPLAHLHMAADYVHKVHKDPLKILERCEFYEEMMNLACHR